MKESFEESERWREGIRRLNESYAHEFSREARRGKKPAIFEDEPIEDKPSLVDLFEQQKAALGRGR